MTVSVQETVTYSFYIESDNVMKEGLTPTFVNFINISDSVEKPSGELPTISEVGAGFYKFDYTWSQTTDPKAYLLKIDTTLTSPAEKHVTMRIEKVDYVSAAVQRIVDIEQGTWKVVNNQLIILHASDPLIELGRWDLFDSSGVNATSTNPFYRVAVNVAPY